ncbi:sigma-70 family RNA polymerase sigma factor [Telluria aromaticivorans]|uniref:Sigma-70 family RNA polymerase sigma factor n=1 Tax=Telluria aromaticivorans TaxID=2725995 RepID=A0A7Y2JUW2_9BURK|nr:sigma-70 family RNA polymerase sigma factor [Telluria aromaticivorans]NNG21420.1 sigma-70 family RNA polymerase sigma factor [Telluria aromaticivorans]
MIASEGFDYDGALAACARGDQGALRRIYDRDSRSLLGVALRIVRHRQIAEDVLHDAFLNIWTRAGSFDPARGAGRGWIYSVVRNQALSLVRSGEREIGVDEELLDDLGAAAAADAGMADAFELHQDLGRLHDCLVGLDVVKRNSILYAYVDGCSHSEIAERLNSPLGTVKTWIRRGLTALRECMG